ncbi:unnamed protein product [Schistosoma curassoni]|uniref:Cytospin-A n=1 Tax=Schistosoma curassoni TaxID=6186 RepID=A0A183JKD4_9TREM|nr:unnamed protein product [Schistosoma curassoni]
MDTSERDMRNLILRAEEDKKRLAQRIEKLTANERALVLELERLKRHGGTSDGRTKRISQLDEFISGIEADRDYWRGQVEILQQMLNYPSLTSGTEGSGIGRTTTSSRLKSKPPTGQHTTTPSKLGGSLKDAKQRKVNNFTGLYIVYSINNRTDRIKILFCKILQYVSLIPFNKYTTLIHRNTVSFCSSKTLIEVLRIQVLQLPYCLHVIYIPPSHGYFVFQ